MTMKRLALVAIASLLALSACTASVRTYSPGYYDAPGYYDRYGYWHYY